jgi:hypothetical protein
MVLLWLSYGIKIFSRNAINKKLPKELPRLFNSIFPLIKGK